MVAYKSIFLSLALTACLTQTSALSIRAIDPTEPPCICAALDCEHISSSNMRFTCPQGFLLNECGCSTSCQCANCPIIDQTISCPNGREFDANGCPTDRCDLRGVLPPCICPANDCGLVASPDMWYTCPHGNIVDECGCVTSCQCASCPPVDETLSCPGGRQHDADGCPLNICVDVADPPCVCPANDCGLGSLPEMRFTCPHGNIVDECGCVTSCQCASCPPVDETLSCPGGRRYDADGCPLNTCVDVADPPCVCRANDCGLGASPDMWYTCPHGNIVDECGCVTSCQCASCPPVDETLSCPGGRQYDADGCPLNTCEAADPPCLCAGNDCQLGALPEMQFTCPHGNIVDECGCVTSCQCASCPPVDENLFCPGGRQYDADGCPLNTCVPCVCPANECNAFLPPDMRYTCPHGHIIDSCRCVTSCQCAGCPVFNTTFSCPGGRKYNVAGCPLDECHPVVEVPVEKPGYCPTYGATGKRSCQDDSDCPGKKKCCPSTDGTTYCRRPLRYTLDISDLLRS